MQLAADISFNLPGQFLEAALRFADIHLDMHDFPLLHGPACQGSQPNHLLSYMTFFQELQMRHGAQL